MLTNEQIKTIISLFSKEIDVEDQEVKFNDTSYYLSEIENEGWSSQGKYETNIYIFELVVGENYDRTGIFVRQGQTRYGSYYSDYEYYLEDLETVEQIEQSIVIKKWVKKEI